MTSAFRLEFADTGAVGVRVSDANRLPAALGALGLYPPRPCLVMVGGAGRFDQADMKRLRALFISWIGPMMARCGAVGVDGGTLAGVMQLFGDAREAAGFPLLGVVAAGTVQLPGRQASREGAASLEPRHTHFMVVPGDRWGAESPWITQAATVLAGTAPAVTVLINGGEIAYSDVERSVQAGRSVVVVAGSGRAADEFGKALVGDSADERAVALVRSGLIRSVSADDPAALVDLLESLLGG